MKKRKKFKVFSLSKKKKKRKRSLDISLQHKNEASYKFSKKQLLHLAEKRAGGERVKLAPTTLIEVGDLQIHTKPKKFRINNLLVRCQRTRWCSTCYSYLGRTYGVMSGFLITLISSFSVFLFVFFFFFIVVYFLIHW